MSQKTINHEGYHGTQKIFFMFSISYCIGTIRTGTTQAGSTAP
jgi:hypothetical protein